MKKIKIFPITLCSALFVLSSCKDALDAPTQSSLDASFIFSTPVLAEEAIMGINQSLCETNSYRDWETDRKSTRLNSSHITRSRMPSSA